MNKSIGLLIILLLFSISAYAETDPNRWAGFRGLKWGTNIKDMNEPHMFLLEDNNEAKTYRRLNDILRMRNAELEEIDYIFYKGRFCGLVIYSKGQLNFTSLKDAVFDYYGEGKQENKSIKYWIWASVFGNSSKDIAMTLEYNESSTITRLFMHYIPINKEIDADKAKKGKRNR